MTAQTCNTCKGWKHVPGTTYISNLSMCRCHGDEYKSQLEDQKKLTGELMDFFLWVANHECDGAKGGGCGICMPCQARKLKAEKSL